MDDNEVCYMSKTTIQASDLKENLENQGITCNNSTTVSTDTEYFCPWARLKLVSKAVYPFSKELSEEDQIIIEHSLDLIKFGMQPTLLAFVTKCYEHDGDGDPEEASLPHCWQVPGLCLLLTDTTSTSTCQTCWTSPHNANGTGFSMSLQPGKGLRGNTQTFKASRPSLLPIPN